MHLTWANLGVAAYRTAVLWAVALIVFRLTGKRTLGKLAAFDFAVIIMMGEPIRSLLPMKMVGVAAGRRA